MWLLFCYFYSEHSCSGDMSVANHTDKSLCLIPDSHKKTKLITIE